MPYRPWEEEQLDPAPEHPVTPTKPFRNAGASHADPNAEVLETESEREKDLGVKKGQAATTCFETRGRQALGHLQKGRDG